MFLDLNKVYIDGWRLIFLSSPDSFNSFEVHFCQDTDVEHSHQKVRDHSNVCSLPFFGLCGRPVQSVQDVLAKG